MYLVYIPKMRVQANVNYHDPPPAHPFFQVFTMSNSADAYRSNTGRENFGILQSRPDGTKDPYWAARAGCTTTQQSSQMLFRPD